VFDEALADPHCTNVLGLEAGDFQANFLCQFGNIGLVDPNESGSTGTTFPTLRALESQAVFVPRF
jgi:hypothetical protein